MYYKDMKFGQQTQQKPVLWTQEKVPVDAPFLESKCMRKYVDNDIVIKKKQHKVLCISSANLLTSRKTAQNIFASFLDIKRLYKMCLFFKPKKFHACLISH